MRHLALITLLITCFSTLSSAHALSRGDQLPPAIAKQLALDPDKISLVDFFASWCVSCRIELPEMNKLSQQLVTAPVEFVGIEVDEDPQLAAEFLAEMALSFRVIDDQSQQVIGAFAPIGMPALYYIKNNTVLGVRYGAIPHIDQVIISDLQQLGLSL